MSEETKANTCTICGEDTSDDSCVMINGGIYYKNNTIIPDGVHHLCINCLIEELEKVREQAIENITKKMSLEQQRLDKLMLSMVKETQTKLDIPEFLKK